MATEIERAFLVANDDWIPQRTDESRILEYGYLSLPDTSVCFRHIITARGAEGRINTKSRGSKLFRLEDEIKGIDPVTIKRIIISICKHRLIKVRHFVGRWEIDEFLGRHRGLVIAEIELSHPEEEFEKPPWLGEEVTEDISYSNEEIAKR